ncbi:MAG: DUF3352 domain-containing protein [Bacteroidetes bacterium]|nr:DUF3352 domain-containing protein [Bacteroidota bacterium]
MSNTWKTILIIFLVCIVAGAGFFGYRLYFKTKVADVSPISAITPSVVAYLEIPDPAGVYSTLNATEIWEYLSGIEAFQNFHHQVAFMDSALASNPSFSQSLKSSRLIISLHPDENNVLLPLFLIPMPKSLMTNSVDDIVKDINGKQSIIMEKPYQKAKIKVVNLPAQNTFFYFTVYRGIFAGSFNEALLKESIAHMTSGSPLSKEASFQQVSGTAGHKVDANLYVYGPNFGPWSASLGNKDFAPLFHNLGRSWDWSEADMVINNDEVLLNGYSITKGTEPQLLDCFAQTPQAITIPEILPYNVAYMAHFGVEKFENFYAAYLEQRSDSMEVLAQLKSYKDKFSISPYDEFISWIGNEFAVAGINHDQEYDAELLVLIKTTDILKARLSLQEASDKINRRQLIKPYEVKYGDYQIRKINSKNLTEVLFGPLFRGMTDNYYILIKDYIVFANSIEILKYVIDNFYKGKTLQSNINYQSFSNNISDKSNIFLYCNIRKSASLSGAMLDGPLNNWIQDNAGTLGNIEGFALQLSYINQMFYTNVYLKYNPDYQEINPSTWSFKTEADVSGQPWFIRNHRNNKLNTVVFDVDNNMYLADHIGKVKWKLPLIEPPLGEMTQIDYYGNGKFQYLFNTKNYIYLIDLNGDYVADYPIKLLQTSTNPVACFDYDNDHDYRFVMALNDNRVYNFDKSMQRVDGWTNIQAKSEVQQPVQHLIADGKDFFFVTDKNGHVIITDRRGDQRIRLKKKIEKAENSIFYINKTNSNGLFLTTNSKGQLVYIDESGQLNYTSFGDFSSGHYFFYEDFDRDGAMDFIFVDGPVVVVYNRFKKEILNYTLSSPVGHKPAIIDYGNDQVLMGLLLSGSGEVILLDAGGRKFDGIRIAGTTGFTAGSINNDDITNLIIANGREVKNYLLE